MNIKYTYSILIQLNFKKRKRQKHGCPWTWMVLALKI